MSIFDNRYTVDDDSRAAISGERLPSYFTHGLDLCTIHAIRHNAAFAKTEAVVKHCEISEDKRYARARNARLIMSNEVPDMATDDVKPYCFWHPNTASEETYRQLVKRYPEMAYYVGRACAVAGYDQLYHELNILPDISVAEEARDNSAKAGSKAIFNHIMRQPICFAVLDDYTRSVNQTPRSPAFMNGDTAVRSTLDVSVAMEDFAKFGDGYFDIAEDRHISETSSHATFAQSQALAPEHVELFYTPLPSHLPTITKDPLIVMAAYEGNLDRYVRLRRPRMLDEEYGAILRGIYHNTTFAKWWSLQEIPHYQQCIRTATIARFIMVNDLSHITKTSPQPNDMPGMIWWPLIPAERTLEVLAERRPDMLLQVAMACIAGDYRLLWDKLAPEPCEQLWEQAGPRNTSLLRKPIRNYYVEYLERRAAELGEDVRYLPDSPPGIVPTRAHDQCMDAARLDKEPTTTNVARQVYLPATMGGDWEGSVYNARGAEVNAAQWELHMCSSEEVRAKIRESDESDGVFSLYNDYDGVHLKHLQTWKDV